MGGRGAPVARRAVNAEAGGRTGARRVRLGPLGLSVFGTIAIFFALAALGSVLAQRIAESEARAGSTARAVVTARVGLAPFLVDGLLARDPEALAPLDAAARRLIVGGQALHIKVWSASGQVLWADTEVAGATFDLDEDERQLFGTEGFTYEIGRLDQAENLFDGGPADRVLEVYLGARTSPSNTPILVETYYSYALVSERAATLRNAFLPILIGGLALLTLAQIPLMVGLARRLDRYQRDRERLLQDVIDTRDNERQRIASQVHDGALQDLIGVSFELSGIAESAPEDMRYQLEDIGIETRRTIRSLRSILSSVYPYVPSSEGFVGGFSDLVEALRSRGVTVELDIPDYELSLLHQDVILRTGREALRNALFHSRCRSIVVRLLRDEENVRFSVRDDGCGFSHETVVRQRRAGHLGLQLIEDLATGVGAVLTVDSGVRAGTEVRLDLLCPALEPA